MFTKILIANRGEIACRIITSARRLGIRSVAVYSTADASARHVALADEAVAIGDAPARDSYLVAERIVQAALDSGAQAIHPGYGFLSENEAFARACEQAGVVFIGPPVSAIRAMGLKSEAKRLMGSAGVPLTPGYHGADQDPETLRDQATRIGYPVLIKASAGGGGKGMRLVESVDEFDNALTSCKRESAASFGNDDVLVEKYIVKPRHIEIQVFGDSHGNFVHLFERDCSVQRRHQKVLEEAPAPGMDDARRAAMGSAAVDAARAVDYQGAGTVEFIVNRDGSFYFMEMNTRLQVEHPVTEMITGQDLVHWQFIVAAGGQLPLTQAQLAINGHALEARIYAENPAREFLPSTGTLERLRFPTESANVRIDTGVREADKISPFYDPMVAKLIVWGPDRQAALAQMSRALSQTHIVGVHNNVAFLSRLVQSPAFTAADLDTGLIEREHDALFAAPEPAAAMRALHIAALTMSDRARSAGNDTVWDAADSWRLNHRAHRVLSFTAGDQHHDIEVTGLSGAQQKYRLRDAAAATPDADIAAHLASDDGHAVQAVLNGRRYNAAVVAAAADWHVFLEGEQSTFTWLDPLQLVQAQADTEASLTAPMPGKLISLAVNAGQSVARGDPLMVIEAMKMEHTIGAPAAGKVVAFHFDVGDQLDEGAVLVDFEPGAA